MLRSEKSAAIPAFAPVEKLRDALVQSGMDVPAIVAGGTPTFPIHAKRAANLNIECSPGTNVLWDASYMQHFPDLNFQLAALVLTRVRKQTPAASACAWIWGTKPSRPKARIRALFFRR